MHTCCAGSALRADGDGVDDDDAEDNDAQA